MSEQNDETDDVDVLADRNLVRISIAEILALQIVAAMIFFVDFVIIGVPICCSFFPFAITVWASYRLRNLPLLTWVNPFTVALGSNFVMFVVLLALGVVDDRVRRSASNTELSESFIELAAFVFLIPLVACFEAFFALLIVRACTEILERGRSAK